MAIREILNKARNIYYVTIHKNGESKHMSLDELTDKEYDLEFEWFEITTFWAKDALNSICKIGILYKHETLLGFRVVI